MHFGEELELKHKLENRLKRENRKKKTKPFLSPFSPSGGPPGAPLPRGPTWHAACPPPSLAPAFPPRGLPSPLSWASIPSPRPSHHPPPRNRLPRVHRGALMGSCPGAAVAWWAPPLSPPPHAHVHLLYPDARFLSPPTQLAPLSSTSPMPLGAAPAPRRRLTAPPSPPR
jgi:hypothetical protein